MKFFQLREIVFSGFCNHGPSYDCDEHQHDANFHDHDRRIEIRRRFDSNDKDRCDGKNRQEGNQVKGCSHLRKRSWIDAHGLDGVQHPREVLPVAVRHLDEHGSRRGGERRREMDSSIVHQAEEITAPPGGNRGGSEGVFKD